MNENQELPSSLSQELPKAICKWKYKTLQPKTKNHKIDRYIEYITKQVEERRETSGNFRYSDETIIGTGESDKKFEQEKYLSYIDQRKGSHSLFSDGGADIDLLEKELKEHKGTAWIPIVSMKEKDAKEFELMTEAQWIDKGRELAEEYRKILGINKDNFHWVAAFHTKPEPDQNRLADAGAMPHIHFILWEGTPTRKRPNLKSEEMATVRTKTVGVLTKDYMKKQYQERNELRASLIEKAKDSLTTDADMIRNLILDIRTTTGGKGKLSVGELEKRRDILERVERKLETKKELSEKESFFLKSNLVKPNLKSVRQKLNNYDYILNQLSSVIDYCLKDQFADLLDQWLEISEKMRSVQGKSLSQDNTRKDLLAMKKVIGNAILNQCKDSSLDNRYITPSLKGMLLERVQFGQFKRGLSFDTIQLAMETFVQLYKSIGLEKQEVLEIGQEILDRSNMESYQEILQDAIDKKYDEELYLQYITTNDFWQTVKAIQLPISKKEFTGLYKTGTSSYQMLNESFIKPQIKTILDIASTKTFLDDPFFKTVTSAEESFNNIFNKRVDRKEEFEENFNSLLDEYNNINQANMDLSVSKDGER